MSTAPCLLDTNVVLQLARNKDLGKRIAAQFGLGHAVYRPLISIVSVGELMALAAFNAWDQARRKFLADMLATLVTVDINDQSVLDAYAELYAVARRAGSAIYQKNDLWIAATAKAANAVLLTTDRDFLVFHPGHVGVQYIDPKMTSPSGETAR